MDIPPSALALPALSLHLFLLFILSRVNAKILGEARLLFALSTLLSLILTATTALVQPSSLSSPEAHLVVSQSSLLPLPLQYVSLLLFLTLAFLHLLSLAAQFLHLYLSLCRAHLVPSFSSPSRTAIWLTCAASLLLIYQTVLTRFLPSRASIDRAGAAFLSNHHIHLPHFPAAGIFCETSCFSPANMVSVCLLVSVVCIPLLLILSSLFSSLRAFHTRPLSRRDKATHTTILFVLTTQTLLFLVSLLPVLLPLPSSLLFLHSLANPLIALRLIKSFRKTAKDTLCFAQFRRGSLVSPPPLPQPAFTLPAPPPPTHTNNANTVARYEMPHNPNYRRY